jgi:uncharacterized integral membrane protein
MYILSKIILLLLLLPILAVCIVVNHVELVLKIGSENDPLGYTVLLKK